MLSSESCLAWRPVHQKQRHSPNMSKRQDRLEPCLISSKLIGSYREDQPISPCGTSGQCLALKDATFTWALNVPTTCGSHNIQASPPNLPLSAQLTSPLQYKTNAAKWTSFQQGTVVLSEVQIIHDLRQSIVDESSCSPSSYFWLNLECVG